MDNTHPVSAKPLAIIIVSLIAVIGVVGAGVFWYQLSRAQRELEHLEDEKAKISTELAVLKATDQALRAELLQEKLSTAERNLVAAQQETASIRERNATLEENARKFQPTFRAVAVAHRVFSGGNLPARFPDVEKAIAALGDPALLARWRNAERVARDDLADGSWSPQPLDDILSILIDNVEQLLRR